jgi:hypothetical protein
VISGEELLPLLCGPGQAPAHAAQALALAERLERLSTALVDELSAQPAADAIDC